MKTKTIKTKKQKLNRIQLDKNTIVYSKHSEKYIREAFKTRRLNSGRLTSFAFQDYLTEPLTA